MKPDLKVLTPEDAPKPPQDEQQSPAQAEMPFAVVDGEPVTTLPQDLYIPPYALQVFLEAFEGPLDLLLYLIRRQNIDILDIPIAEITKQYVQYIELMKELQLELAGEYLVMAAMLAEIKSSMLLPRPETEEEDEEDPRAELVRRLAGIRALQEGRPGHIGPAAHGARHLRRPGGCARTQGRSEAAGCHASRNSCSRSTMC